MEHRIETTGNLGRVPIVNSTNAKEEEGGEQENDSKTIMSRMVTDFCFTHICEPLLKISAITSSK